MKNMNQVVGIIRFYQAEKRHIAYRLRSMPATAPIKICLQTAMLICGDIEKWRAFKRQDD
jgi:hypothetical protein